MGGIKTRLELPALSGGIKAGELLLIIFFHKSADTSLHDQFLI